MRWNFNASSSFQPGRLLSAFFIALTLFMLAFSLNLILRNAGSTAKARRMLRDGDITGLNAAITANPKILLARDPTHQATLLHIAVDADKFAGVALLLRLGSDIDARDKYRMTPLHKAAIFNRLKIAELLIENGADLNALAPKYGHIFVSPLHLAAEAGAADMIDLLAEYGCNMNPQRSAGPVNPSPLHLAAAKGRYAGAKALLDHGADPWLKDRNGRTANDWANEMQHAEVAHLLQHAMSLSNPVSPP